MQLGDCWFDATKGELNNRETGKTWHLPRAELQVLQLLVEHQGKLVSKRTLKEQSGEHPALSDSSVARAVFMIRSFLGPRHESLIQTVKGKGYQLQYVEQPLDDVAATNSINSSSTVDHSSAKPNASPVSDVVSRLDNPAKTTLINRPAIVLGAILLVFVMAASLWFMASHRHVPHNSQPYLTETIALSNGKSVGIHLYAASNTNSRLLLQQAKVIKSSFRYCEDTSWKQIYVSLSHDNQVLNVTLSGESLGQSVVRNFKISDNRSPKFKSFVTSPWLQEVKVCDY